MRMNSLKPKKEYEGLAKTIAEKMPSAGSDLQRGGWYDMLERIKGPGEKYHRFVWHDRKAWWHRITSYNVCYTKLLRDVGYF